MVAVVVVVIGLPSMAKTMSQVRVTFCKRNVAEMGFMFWLYFLPKKEDFHTSIPQ